MKERLYNLEFNEEKFMELYNTWFPKVKDIFQVLNKEDENTSWDILKAVPLEEEK